MSPRKTRGRGSPIPAGAGRRGRLGEEAENTSGGSARKAPGSPTATVDNDGRLDRLIASVAGSSRQNVVDAIARLLAAVTDRNVGGVAAADLEGRLIYVNDAWADLHGWHPEEMVGKHLSVNHFPEHAESVEASVDATRKAGVFRGEIWHAHRDGTVFPTLMQNSLLRDAGGRPTHLIGTCIDLTHRKKAEQVLAQSQMPNAELETAVATGRMAARIAHEISNPLAGITNCFRLVREAVPEGHPNWKFISLIESELERIDGMVRQMYELHRPSPQRWEEFNVAEAIHRVVVMLEPLSRQYEVAVETAVAADCPDLRLPRGTLAQVLYNLLANAIEASPPKHSVKVEAAASHGQLRISVADRGPGVPERVRARIFEPFFTTKHDAASGGLGLGLSISRQILDSLGGSIGLADGPDGGAVFEVVLPTDLDEPKQEGGSAA